MENSEQERFMYLFERIGEPLYLGPRGADTHTTYYEVPMDYLDENEKKFAIDIRRELGASKKSKVIVKNRQSGMRMPDIKMISGNCSKQMMFSNFDPLHRKAAEHLKEVLLEQATTENFMSMGCICRDNKEINSQLWLFAFSSALLQRPDLRGFRMPPIYEITPDRFIPPQSIREAQVQAVMPTELRKPIEINQQFTGDNRNPENKVAYFREDLGLNSHHWHWHLIYTKDVVRDRRGELFYYAHHAMLARYDAERLCNGLLFVKPLDIDEPVIEEGYFPNLYDSTSGMTWGTRQANTRLMPVTRNGGGVSLSLLEIRKVLYRLYDAIDTRTVITENGQMKKLTPETGTDLLGTIVENSGVAAKEYSRYYGALHDMGHNLLANCHDPNGDFRHSIGVIASFGTASRDPAFWRWHKFVDNVFLYWQRTLPSYQYDELKFPGITVKEIRVQSKNREENILVTHWVKKEIDLARGLDFGRTSQNRMGPIKAQLTSLDHMPFQYKIKVTNDSPRPVYGRFRIFMAPGVDDKGQAFDGGRQWVQFFEMDKFIQQISPGTHVITRKSEDASVAIPWEQSFEELEKMMENPQPTAEQARCGCGWPNSLLIPRGSKSGSDFDLFVMVTDASQDQVKSTRKSSNNQKPCQESSSYCGILDDVYPDKKPMNYPFDRIPISSRDRQRVNDLHALTREVPNATFLPIRIIHLDKVIEKASEDQRKPTGSPSVTFEKWVPPPKSEEWVPPSKTGNQRTNTLNNTNNEESHPTKNFRKSPPPMENFPWNTNTQLRNPTIQEQPNRWPWQSDNNSSNNNFYG